MKFWLLLMAAALPVAAQTTDHRNILQVGAWDASSAKLTRPNRTGPALPANCSSGETFQTTSGALYVCVAGAWKQISGHWTLTSNDLVYTAGNVGIGGAPVPNRKLQVYGTTAFMGDASLFGTSADNYFASPLVFYKRGAAGNADAAPASNAELGYIDWRGWTGSTYNRSAMVMSVAAAAFSGTSSPGHLDFYTTPAGTTAAVHRLRISSAGLVGIGKTNPTTALDVAGTLSAEALQGALDWSYLQNTPATFPPAPHNHDSQHVSLSGSYANPSWLTSLAWGKLTGAPSAFTPSTHATTHAEAGSDPVALTQAQVTGLTAALAGKEPANSNIQAHIASTSNPHTVTKAQVGLGNVENTALSTWAGSGAITSIGTLASGAVPWSLVTAKPSTFPPEAHSHSAGEISGGTLAAARGGLGVDASAMSGVLKVASGTASVVTGSASDCIRVDGSSGSCGAGGAGAYDPSDASVVTIVEDFLSGTTTTGQIGQYGFRIIGGSPTQLSMTAVAGRVGVFSQATNTTNGNASIMWFSPSTSSTFAQEATVRAREFVVRWYGRITDTSTADYRVGLSTSIATSGGTPGSSSVTWMFRSSTTFGDNTKNGGSGSWVVQICGYGGSNCATDTSGVTHVMNAAPDTNWHMFEISNAGGVMSFRIDNGSPVTVCPSGCTISNPWAPQTDAIAPWASVQTNTTSARAWHWDRFYLRLTGLSTF